ncbi:hypothetical protein [Azoarcus indigens]|uniref:PEGA domain-containing protein n=1 Tax=Azoarcus indigens TaxID=29545 RepID=A0A4R6DHB7_9RHOO|nr:hypothetical protein [Azoarcus indigens]TDN44105.1 hypothetical protein C7389_13622 [Azoarcus indigens]
MKLRNIVLPPLLATMVGCATIMGNPVHVMPISSTPSDASITIIDDETGKPVFKGSTPTSVPLEKSNGSYWGGKSYTVKISKPGFEEQTIPVKASANGWYIAGNFLFGGLIGWFIVDPMNGKMYNLSPENISSTLGAKAAHNNKASDGSIAVMLIQDVPAELRGQLQQIN